MTHMQIHTTCDDCVDLLQNAASVLRSCDKKLTTLYDEQFQLRLLANVASSKCHMCVLLHSRISRLSEPLESEEKFQIVVYKASSDPLAAGIGLVGHSTAGITGYTGSIRVHEAGHGTIRTVDSSQTWSLETLNSIKFWMKQCTSCHDTCLKPQVSKDLPLRLIDVDISGKFQIQPSTAVDQEEFDRLRLSDSDGVRIVSTQSLRPDTEYLTLSHRWGSPPGIMLSKGSLINLIDDVSPLLLKCAEAAVFQHAIHVTRCLGFQYLWIDALCIMQDDEEEKKAEIMRMDDIYFNSKLTISATEADPIRGLVFDRQFLHTNPFMTIAKVPRTNDNMFLHVFDPDPSPHLWDKPLNKRGWVFQERLLSPRVIQFTKEQVYWECWSLKASEVLPEGLSEEVKHYETSGDFNFNKRIGILPDIFDLQHIKWRWYEIVWSYSRTSLSFADDRLLAISAVGKRFCSAMRMDPSEYLAGMWRDDLPISLLWRQETIPGRSGPSETGSNLEMKYAPSWSWASVMVSVTTYRVLRPVPALTTEVIDIEVKRRSQNLFDGTDLCRLRLRGPICKFRRHLIDGIPWIQIPEDNDFKELGAFNGIRKGRHIFISWDTARRFTMTEYFLMQIGDTDGKVHLYNLERGLVLLRTAEHGTYKRVGTFLISLLSEYSGSKLEGAFKGEFHTLSKEDYLELNSDGRYTIDII